MEVLWICKLNYVENKNLNSSFFRLYYIKKKLKKTLFKKILVGFAFSPNLKANIFTSLRLANSLEAELFLFMLEKNP